MKTRVFFAAGLAALLVLSSAAAQTRQIPNLNQLPQQSPTPQLQPPAQQNPGAPIAPQGTLPVTSFTVSNLRCAAGLGSATQHVTATLAVQGNPASGNRAQIDVLINGVSQGAQTLISRDGAVQISRDINVLGAQGQHQAVFVLDGVVQSAPQAFEHACVTQRQTRIDATPGVLTLPNLAVADLVYAELSVTTSGGDRGSGGRVPVGGHGFRNPTIVRDATTTTGRLDLPSPAFCPTELDAFVTARIAVAIRVTRVTDPLPYVTVTPHAVGYVVGTRPMLYLDATDREIAPDGFRANSGGIPLPRGYQWISYRTQLPCTRDGLLEIRLDPDNRLRESNEADNVLRLRFATVP